LRQSRRREESDEKHRDHPQEAQKPVLKACFHHAPSLKSLKEPNMAGFGPAETQRRVVSCALRRGFKVG
jgi:hypothetical protein